jgi:uncharacterized protein YndB with AHSA1/START domain
MPESTPAAETQAKFRVEIRGSIEDVWQEITRTDAPIAAFFNSRMEVGRFAAGSRLAMRSPDGKYTGVVGEILEYDPPHRFAHTFQFTQYEDSPCTVIYDLEKAGGVVQFTLTVADMPVGTKTAKQMRQGGSMIVNTLKAVIETGRPALGTRVLFGVFKLMAPMTPKKCLSENWPVKDSAPGSHP